MKKLLYLISFLLIVMPNSYGQKKQYNLQVAMGITGRGSIKYSKYSTPFYNFAYSLHGQNKYNFIIDVKSKIFNDKITLQISNNFDFGLLRSGTDIYGLRFEEKAVRRGHFLDIIYNKKTKNKIIPKLLFGFGYGIGNAGTSFIYSSLNNGSSYNLPKKETLKYLAPRITFGLEKGAFNTFLIAYYTGRDNYYNKTPAYFIEGKLTITFPKFEKRKK